MPSGVYNRTESQSCAMCKKTFSEEHPRASSVLNWGQKNICAACQLEKYRAKNDRRREKAAAYYKRPDIKKHRTEQLKIKRARNNIGGGI